jgi:hypothetical protein
VADAFQQGATFETEGAQPRHRLLDHFFADGATRNSNRWDLYLRFLGDADFSRADGMITPSKKHVRNL